MRGKISRTESERFGAVRIYTGAGQQARSTAELAEIEARAILAETEPAHGWNDCAWPLVGHYATLDELNGGPLRLSPLQAGVALAEALATFLAS